MASRILTRAARSTPSLAIRTAPCFQISPRLFHSSPRSLAEVVPLPVRKPVGAFRGGLLGFFVGATLAGAGVFYYGLEEYKVSNELLTEDIYSLQASVQRVHTYVSNLEEKLDALEKKKK